MSIQYHIKVPFSWKIDLASCCTRNKKYKHVHILIALSRPRYTKSKYWINCPNNEIVVRIVFLRFYLWSILLIPKKKKVPWILFICMELCYNFRETGILEYTIRKLELMTSLEVILIIKLWLILSYNYTNIMNSCSNVY